MTLNVCYSVILEDPPSGYATLSEYDGQPFDWACEFKAGHEGPHTALAWDGDDGSITWSDDTPGARYEK